MCGTYDVTGGSAGKDFKTASFYGRGQFLYKGDNVGIELDGLEKNQIAPGDQLVGYLPMTN